ncbi:hypothetical protein [Glycomyces sp. NPDC047010]|uniref:hypothetical protein n=1 Tax=Glycomyces sp. NPDC047010 TaxID=3155023 RepID=UPI0033C774AE
METSKRVKRTYDAYLEMYGHVYGNMSDPIRRAEVVASLRQRDALQLASARRECRAIIGRKSTLTLICDRRVKVYQIEKCAHVRPWNVIRSDIHDLRMIDNELKKRGVSA